MPSTKQIKNKITSIKNTKKITGAMELVAASKMKRSNSKAIQSRPYANAIYELLRRSSNVELLAASEYTDNKQTRHTGRHGYILITTDRGLCGGLNVNLFKAFLLHLQQLKRDTNSITTCVFGKKGVAFLRRMSIDIQLTAPIKDNVDIEYIIAANKVMANDYIAGKIDTVQLAYNDFINNMTYKPKITQLLPLALDQQETTGSSEYLYDTDPNVLLEALVSRYLESLLQHALLENIACEQASRMLAMKSATDNAQSLADQLQLIFNKNRQAAITQEISEIVAGTM